MKKFVIKTFKTMFYVLLITIVVRKFSRKQIEHDFKVRLT